MLARLHHAFFSDAFNTELLLSCMEKLKHGQAISIPNYDFKSHRSIEAARVVINFIFLATDLSCIVLLKQSDITAKLLIMNQVPVSFLNCVSNAVNLYILALSYLLITWLAVYIMCPEAVILLVSTFS